MEKFARRKWSIVLGIVCIVLLATLAETIINYNSVVADLNLRIAQKDDAIASLNSQILNLSGQLSELSFKNDQVQSWLNGNSTAFNSQINELKAKVDSANSQLTDLHRQIASDNSTIANLREQVESGNRIVTALNSTVTLMQGQAETNKATIAGLQSQLDEERTKTSNLGVQAANLQSHVENLTAIVNALKPKPQTLVFHVCEKGEGYEWGRLPDSNSTYNEILNLTSDAYNVLLIPEYMGNEHWNETFAWLKKNFTGIPLMLTVFEGGTLDYPLQMLTTGQISEAMNSLDVRGIRIFEVVSWHIEHNMTFPVDYVTNLLTFCRANNLTVFWSEWKIGDDVFGRIQNYIAGFEDIVVVSFGTNSGDLEPADGFLLVGKMFEHWGGSVQSWYWVTRYGGDPLDMPISLFIDHALLAKFMGAEVIQFEPYWYFFDNGLANENVKLLADALNAQ